MTEEPSKPTSASELVSGYVLENKRDIDKIRDDVSTLMRQDMGLDHKMDMLGQRLDQLNEGFGHSRETGHKTWEAVQRMVASLEHQKVKFDSLEKDHRTTRGIVDWMVRGLIAVVGIAVLMAYLQLK